MPETLTISPAGAGDKGRTFTVALISAICADRSWDFGRSQNICPVYLCYAESHSTVRAFTANLRSGRPAMIRDAHGRLLTRQLELPTAARMRWPPPRRDKGSGVTVVTAYSPELCDLEPADLSPERIRFLFAPPRWWVDAQISDSSLSGFPEGDRRELAMAVMFAAFIDRRSPMPPIRDPEFCRRLYRGAQRQPWYGVPAERMAPGNLAWAIPQEPPGIEMVAVVDVEHEVFEEFYRHTLDRYFREVKPAWIEDRPAIALPTLAEVDAVDNAAAYPVIDSGPLVSAFDW